MKRTRVVQTDPRHPRTQLNDRLIVGGKIATGGMGVVLEGYDTNLSRSVAVKKLRRDLRFDLLDSARGRLIEEAQITAQLDHPNIVAVHELSVDESGEIFFTMKRVRGQEFGRVLRQSSTTARTPRELFEHLQVFLKVCDTVAFANSCGVVHQDLKPDNIMVGDFGEVYVMDWGLAQKVKPKITSSSQEYSSVILQDRYNSRDSSWAAAGTLWYLTPEQALGHADEIDQQTDVFLLGGVLYEILTHSPPYRGNSEDELVEKAIKGLITPPDERTPASLPPRLCKIAMKALSVNKEERFSTVLDLKKAVEDVLQTGWQFETREYPAGALVIQENDTGSEAFIIEKGTCRAFKTLEGQKFILREMGRGEVFGEIAVLTNEPRTASVETLTPTVLHVIKREDFDRELGMGALLGNFMRTLSERFLEKDQLLTDLESKLRKIESTQSVTKV